jgi:hypothetical protein
MAPKTTKQQVKRAVKKVARKDVARTARKGFARIAALVDQTAEATARDVAEVKHQIADLADRSGDVSLTAAGAQRGIEEVSKRLDRLLDPRQLQLHRRVQVSVLDKDGVRLSNTEYDLSQTGSLSLSVCGAGVTASVTENDR